MVGAVVLTKVYRSLLATVRCDVCDQKVRYNSKTHREECALRHREFLSNLPSPFDIRYEKEEIASIDRCQKQWFYEQRGWHSWGWGPPWVWGPSLA